VRAVDAQVSAWGFSKVEAAGHPDVLVAYHASFDRNLEINASGWGGYRLAGPRSGTARVEEVVVGTKRGTSTRRPMRVTEWNCRTLNVVASSVVIRA
jgi:hypothetical protein